MSLGDLIAVAVAIVCGIWLAAVALLDTRFDCSTVTLETPRYIVAACRREKK